MTPHKSGTADRAPPINGQWSRESEKQWQRDITITIADDLQARQKSTGFFNGEGGRCTGHQRVAGRIVWGVWVWMGKKRESIAQEHTAGSNRLIGSRHDG